MVPITPWAFDGRNISLLPGAFWQSNCFLVEGADRKITVEPSRYDLSRAKTLIEMFHQTIEENLRREPHRDSCFLPVWSMRAHNAPELEIALFGHLDITFDNPNNPEGKAVGMRWGVYNTSTKTEEQFLEVKAPLASVFIEKAPLYKNAMENYAKRFRIDVTPKSGKVQEVALRYVSLLDKNVFLDEDSWAVTLADLGTSEFRSSSTWGGHAVIIIEAIENDEYHVWRGDLIEGINGLAKARFWEISTETLMAELENHPRTETYGRHRSLVQIMKNQIELEAARSTDGKPIGFINGNPIRFGLTGMTSLQGEFRNCTTWARERASLADIDDSLNIMFFGLQTPGFYINPSPALGIINITYLIGLMVINHIIFHITMGPMGALIKLAVEGSSEVLVLGPLARSLADADLIKEFSKAVTSANRIREFAGSIVLRIEKFLEEYGDYLQKDFISDIQARVDASKKILKSGHLQEICCVHEELAECLEKEVCRTIAEARTRAVAEAPRSRVGAITAAYSARAQACNKAAAIAIACRLVAKREITRALHAR